MLWFKRKKKKQATILKFSVGKRVPRNTAIDNLALKAIEENNKFLKRVNRL
ncbi:hypothetical protein [Peribacillus butanolivorans]|uniref:hypothetical protein n=1 Tax=Peribacillus butanolivorans TaxID=421767 RepID=UPI0036505AE7